MSALFNNEGVQNMSYPQRKIDTMNPRELIYNKFQVGIDSDPVAVIFDGANFYHFAREMGINIDFDAVSKILYANFPCLRNMYYITSEYLIYDPSDHQYPEGRSQLRPLLDFLRYNRYSVITRLIEKNENYPVDNSMDVEIVSTLYQVAKWAKHIVFFGSSRKFETPLKDIKNSGVTITVVSSTNAGNKSVADELRKIDNFVDINDSFFELINNKKDRVHYISGVGNIMEKVEKTE